MHDAQKNFNSVFILALTLLFSNCTAWPSIAAMLIESGNAANKVLPFLPTPSTSVIPIEIAPIPTPEVTNNLIVSTVTVSGYYPAGTVIDINIKFLEAVDVTGIPQLILNNAVNTNYLSGTGTDTLLFRYTVQAGNGEDVIGLDSVSQTALILNGGTIKSVATTSNMALTLPVPGAVNSLGNGKVIVIDTVVPTVTNVTSSSSDAVYGLGGNVTVQIVFSEVVNVVGGQPQIILETGAMDRTVNCSSGTGTAILSCTYTVQIGDTSADLDYVATNSFTLNGATIRDEAFNNAILTLASPSAVNSLGANKAIVVNTNLPSITNMTSSLANGSYTVGQVVPIQITFSQAVNVTGTPQLTLETGATDAIVNYLSGDGTNTLTFNYTVVLGHSSLDLDYQSTTALGLNGGTIKDTGNVNDATLTLAAPGAANSLGANQGIEVDTNSPGVTSVNSTTADGSYLAGQTISIQVIFNENVIVSGTPQLTLDTGAVANYVSGTGTSVLTFTYIIGAGQNSIDLDYMSTVSLALNGGTMQDAVGNNAMLTLISPGVVNSLGANKAIVIDTTQPTVTSVNSSTADGSYRSGQSIFIQVNFSENVTVVGTPQLTLETGGTDAVVDYASGSGSYVLTFTYTVGAGHTSVDLDYINTTSLALNGGTISDVAGNASTPTLATPGTANSLGANKAIVIDTAAPTITSVNSSTVDGTYKSSDAVSIQVNFSENVTVVGTPQFTLETGGIDAVVNYVSGTGTSALTFTYTIGAGQTSNDLDYQSTGALSLNGGTINDAAENAATLTLAATGGANSLGANKAIVLDTTGPTVTSVNSVTANGIYESGQAVSVQVNFSENVTVTGTPQLTLETGGTDAVIDYVSGSGTSVLTFTYTIGAGQNSIDLDYQSTTALVLNGGTMQDAVGNNATLTLVSPGVVNSLGANKAIVIDTTVPTVTNITSSTGDGTYGVGQAVSVQVNFSENVTVTGTPQLTLETGGTDAVVDYASGTGTTSLTFTYTIATSHTSADLDYQSTGSLALNGGTIRDSVNNNAILTLAATGGANSLAGNKAIVINTTTPTVYFSAATSSGSETSTAVTIPVILSAVSALSVTVDYAVTGGTATGTDYTLASGTLTFAQGETSKDISITVVNETLHELDETIIIGISNPANSTLGATTSHTYTINNDDALPTVQFSASTSSSGDESSTTRTVAVTLSPASGQTVTVTATDSGGTATSGTDYTVIGSPLTVTFNPGVTSQNVSIPVLQDLIYEAASETVQLTLSAPSNATLGGVTGHTFTITDDDFGIVSAETMDADNNGKIDHYKITFSEAVSDSYFPGYIANSLGLAQTKWLIGGTDAGVVLSHGTAEAALADTANDAVIYLKFTEAGVYDTDSKPNLTTTATPDLLAVSARTLEVIATATVTEVDRAKPVVVTNSGSSISTNLTVTFSEPVWGASGMPACGGGGDVTASSLTYSNVSGNGASSFTGMGADSCGTDSIVIFVANTIFTSADNSSDTIAGNGNIYDSANNTGNTTAKLLTITLGPTITNIQQFDTNKNGKIDQLKVTFSTNMTDSTIADIDASRFTVGGTAATKVNTGTGIIASPNNDPGTANDTIITLFTDDSTVSGTSALSVAFLLNAGKWMGNGIELQTIGDLSSVVEDKAPPVILTAVASDNTTLAVGVDSDDTLVITFSEGTDKATINTANIASILSLSSSHVWGTITSATWNLAGDVLTITFAGSGSTIAIGDTITILGTITDTAAVPNVSTNIAAANSSSGTFSSVDTSTPTIASASSMATTTVRVVYSKAMNATEAATAANYKIVVAPASGVCSDNTNFTLSTQTTDFNISSVLSISGTTYDLTLSAPQVASKSYSLIANKSAIHDLQPITLSCPNNADFTGNEQLKTSSAVCVLTTSLILSFSKPVYAGQDIAMSAGCTTSTECQKRYAITGVSTLTPTTAKILDGTVCGGATADSSKVCITHPEIQGGGLYTITVANATDGDGFNNTTGGFAWVSPFAIRNSADTENVKTSPNDRVSFTGCGTAPQNFVDGPLASDPFGTGLTDFSYIFSFNNRVYLGPNEDGTSGINFRPDGTDPVNITFGLHQDPNTLGAFINTAYGSPPSQLFPSFGKTGCTTNSASCGPNNQNGRGLFTSGTIAGTDYLFGGSYYSPGNLKDIYVTTDTDARPDFQYLRFSGIIGGANLRGFMAARILDNALWMSFPDAGGASPKLAYITAFGSLSTPNATQHGYALPTGIALGGNGFPAVGISCDSFTANNKNVSVDTFIDFNGLMYTGGGGCPSFANDGGLARGKIAAPALNTDLTVITPINATWSNGNTRFSRYLSKLADFTPQDKAFPQMAVFQSKLFIARNTCEGFTCPDLAIDDCTCPAANRHAQLWMCTPATVSGPAPATATACDAGDWTLVADNGSGQTSMGDNNNKTISLVVTNGSYLYVGFDNSTTGVEVWRTNVAVPAIGDFGQIGADGLGTPSNNTQIFDGMSFLYSGTNYLYLTTGKSAGIVKAYRQQN